MAVYPHAVHWRQWVLGTLPSIIFGRTSICLHPRRIQTDGRPHDAKKRKRRLWWRKFYNICGGTGLIRLLSMCCVTAMLISCAGHYYQLDGNDITLTLQKREAQKVLFYCSLNGYSPQPLTNESGRWRVKLPANQSFRYFYRIDDRLFVPDCRLKEKDDFGWENCLYDPD